MADPLELSAAASLARAIASLAGASLAGTSLAGTSQVRRWRAKLKTLALS
jgi:hypothetical protein